MWNLDIDVDAMLDEYCRGMFGPAATDVAAYYRTIIQRWEGTLWKDVTDSSFSDACLADSSRGRNGILIPAGVIEDRFCPIGIVQGGQGQPARCFTGVGGRLVPVVELDAFRQSGHHP